MSPAVNDKDLLEVVRATLKSEAAAILQVEKHVGTPYLTALKLLAGAKGKVIVTGMGKSGIIARKVAASLSSTGSPAVFLHPGDALHGDLGLVAAGDVVIAFGKSGESDELNNVIPALKRLSVKIIAVTGRADSTLATMADCVLNASIDKEACPHDLMPTSSTTAALAIGDALAIALSKLKNFSPDDFALYHPGGKLGRKLLLSVADLMIALDQCPMLNPDTVSMEDVIISLGKFGLGIVLFSRDGRVLAGILTDGDLRRLLNARKKEIFDLRVADVMNSRPLSIEANQRAVHALRYMEDRERPLNVLPVLTDGRLIGILRLHELVRVS